MWRSAPFCADGWFAAVAPELATGENEFRRVYLRQSGATKMKRARRPMKKQTAVAIAIGVAFAATPPAHADNDWIAMAISDSTGQLKFTSGGASQAAAQQTVMDACRKTISDCRLLASGEGGCVALVVNASNTKYYGAWGPTREEAQAAASALVPGGKVQTDHTHCQGDPSS